MNAQETLKWSSTASMKGLLFRIKLHEQKLRRADKEDRTEYKAMRQIYDVRKLIEGE